VDKATEEALLEPLVRKLANILLGIALVAILFWIAGKYLDPGLRMAIVYSGFGMC